MDMDNNLHFLDYIILGLVLFCTIGIGLYFAISGNRQRSTAEYFTGNNNLGFLSTIVSISVTFLSGVGMIGIPTEIYLYGGSYVLNTMSLLIGACAAAVFVVPVVYPLKLLSVNKYVELRYGSKVLKWICTFCVISNSVVYMAVITYVPAVVLTVFTGWPIWAIIVALSLIAILVTSIGGIKAVIWTDVLLFICMVVGMILIIFQATSKVGGVNSMWNIIQDGNRLKIFDFRPDPTIRFSVWSFLLGADVFYFIVYSFNQSSVQRYTWLGSIRRAQGAVFLSGLAYAILLIFLVATGLSIFGYYAHIGCDPLSSGQISSPNQLVAFFVKDAIDIPGFQGVFIASIAAGSLSTVSSMLNSVAANTWDDIMKHFFSGLSPSRSVLFCKLVVVCYGIISTLLAFLVVSVGGTIFQFGRSLNSFFSIPLGGLFVAGIFCPWMNRKGIFAGLVASFGTISTIIVGQYTSAVYKRTMLTTSTANCSAMGMNITLPPQHDHWTNATLSNNLDDDINDDPDDITRSPLQWFYSISYLYYTVMGLIVFISVGSGVSLCVGRGRSTNTDDKFIALCLRRGGGDINGNKEEKAMLESTKC